MAALDKETSVHVVAKGEGDAARRIVGLKQRIECLTILSLAAHNVCAVDLLFRLPPVF